MCILITLVLPVNIYLQLFSIYFVALKYLYKYSYNARNNGVIMDFQKIVKELLATGISQNAIAERCNVSQVYISYMAIGKRSNPSFTVGNKLLEMHKEIS